MNIYLHVLTHILELIAKKLGFLELSCNAYNVLRVSISECLTVLRRKDKLDKCCDHLGGLDFAVLKSRNEVFFNCSFILEIHFRQLIACTC